ncbi:MAG: hypothetical protein QM296_00460 [Bacillota bacterium]|nr:hypothetical protein [Bacillota bacterium]
MITVRQILVESSRGLIGQWGMAIIVTAISIVVTTTVIGISGGIALFLPFLAIFKRSLDLPASYDEFRMITTDAFIAVLVWSLIIFLIAALINLLVGTYLRYTFQAPFRGGRIDFDSGFQGLREAGYDRAFATQLRVLTISFLLFLLAAVPGLIYYYGASQAVYLVRDDTTLTPQEAIRASRRLMRGHKRRIFTAHLLLALIPILWMIAVSFLLLLSRGLPPLPAALVPATPLHLLYHWSAFIGWLSMLPLLLYSLVRLRAASACFHELLIAGNRPDTTAPPPAP